MEQSRLPLKLLEKMIHNNGGWKKILKVLSEDADFIINNYTHIGNLESGSNDTKITCKQNGEIP